MVGDEKKKGRFTAMRRMKGQGNGEKGSSVGRRRAAPASRSSPRRLTAFVKVFGSEGERDRIYPLDKKDEYTIGRTSDADIPLADRKVSRKHCKIVRKGMRYYVVDLNSRNGTLLGGKKVKRHLLKDGDQIQVGMSRLLFFKAKKTDVVLQFAKERKCALCGRTVTQADLLSGKAEEVDGSVFCSACIAQAMGEEVVEGATPADMAPPPGGVTVRMTTEEAEDKSATPSAQHQPTPPEEEKGKTTEKDGTVSPSSAPVNGLKQELQRGANTTPRESDGASVSDDTTDEDVSGLRKQERAAAETIHDKNASNTAALSELPQVEDLSVFEDADVDKLIDELLEDEE